MQKKVAFHHYKDIVMSKLGCILPNLANIFLQKSTDTKISLFAEADENFLEKTREDVVGGLLSFLHAKQLLLNLYFESVQTYANQLLALMLANFTEIRCVNSCPPVFIRVGMSIQRQVDSYLDNTRVSLKICSCPIFNEQDRIAKMKASIQKAHRRKVTASALMGFFFIATLYSPIAEDKRTRVPIQVSLQRQ